jgi:hypothetical protein
LFPLVFYGLAAQNHEAGYFPEMIRGEVFMELEPIYGFHVDRNYPLDVPTAGRRALDEAALSLSAMIYGWSFHYDVGEQVRKTDEKLELEIGHLIKDGDPGLKVTDLEVKDGRVHLWVNYALDKAQQSRMQIWRTGMIRSAQAVGYGVSGSIEEFPGWLEVKKTALEDAARVALRTLLRASERNRPKEVNGFISLASFPRYFMKDSRWAVSARFRVQITEIIPFAAY